MPSALFNIGAVYSIADYRKAGRDGLVRRKRARQPSRHLQRRLPGLARSSSHGQGAATRQPAWRMALTCVTDVAASITKGKSSSVAMLVAACMRHRIPHQTTSAFAPRHLSTRPILRRRDLRDRQAYAALGSAFQRALCWCGDSCGRRSYKLRGHGQSEMGEQQEVAKRERAGTSMGMGKGKTESGGYTTEGG